MLDDSGDTIQTGAEAVQQTTEADTPQQRSARLLAEEHQVTYEGYSRPDLLGRLHRQEAYLREEYRALLHQDEEEGNGESIRSYASEWLLDNFYIILRAIREVSEDMPAQYYHQLPKLTNTDLAGYPRIYAIALHIVRANDARLDVGQVQRYLEAYQEVKPLTVGEIWAAPTMLRLFVIEALTQAVSEISAEPFSKNGPDALRILSELQPDALIANSITSLRMIDTHDWKDFFESVSLVERILCQDPAGIYNRMDFSTRDSYRKVVEELAFNSERNEPEIAQVAVELAGQAPPDASLAQQHVGEYLIGPSYLILEQAVDYSPPFGVRLKRWFLSHPGITYFGSVGAIIAALLALLLLYAAAHGASALGLVGVGLLVLVPAWTMAVSFVNWLLTQLIRPRLLPKMDFSEQIPEDFQTMVVIPALISSPGEVESLLRQLELHYLQNNAANLHFGLLTDFADAHEQHMPDDEALLDQASRSIQQLNQRYAGSGSGFFLFHRRRKWNPKMNRWMGWERKRGKIEELNRLILGENSTSYIVQEGDLNVLPHIHFVITLDADTVLPRGNARRLIGCLAHPLNRPQFNPYTNRIVSGYSILQPRAEIKPASANQTLFTRIFAGRTGLDLYTHAVSDMYQDLFGEGIYVGKGIYDVAAFARSLSGRVPENALLSHDLFEGIQGRAGLVSDIVLYEDYPPDYLSFTRRLQRWIRGDWQLVPWLLPWNRNLPGAGNLEPVDRWKMLDNLQRSLLPISLLVLLFAAWFGLPGSPALWISFALLAPGLPFVTSLLTSLLVIARGESTAAPGRAIRDEFFRWLLTIVFIPYEAILSFESIITTLYRVFISRRNLLDWTTAARTTAIFSTFSSSPHKIWEPMAFPVVLGLLFMIVLGLHGWRSLAVALPFLILWLASPIVAYQISEPFKRRVHRLSEQDIWLLRRLARRTWYFFEKFVGPEDHWLPPDHFQEDPKGVVAHRTSPTNIGLLLASTLGAYDMGYLGLLDVGLRLQSTYDTLSGLEQYRGHFLNWYDTRTLAPLPARYVSTVDSGNLIACMVVAKEGCEELLRAPVLAWRRWEGLFNSISIMDKVLESVQPVDKKRVNSIRDALERMQLAVQEQRGQPAQWGVLIDIFLQTGIPQLERDLLDLIDSHGEELAIGTMQSLRTWADRIRHHVTNFRRETEVMIPWLYSLNQPPAAFATAPAGSSLTAAWNALVASLPLDLTMLGIPDAVETAREHLASLHQALDAGGARPEQLDEARIWLRMLEELITRALGVVQGTIEIYRRIIDQSDAYVTATDFDFLFNPRRKLFRIGYNVDTGNRDPNYYDLLASEARIASLLAIGKGDVPQSHWLHLGRPLTYVHDRLSLLSWSGSMFEYLMPVLFMPQFDNTLLDQTNILVVQRQIDYARAKDVPWGISESGYYRFDANNNYQYRAFGVPGLGLKRGLEDDLVITPYASVLALDAYPAEVVRNVRDLAEMDMLQDYGLYEAVDFTSRRLPLGRRQAIVRSFMSHHQGMIFLSLQNFLQSNPTVRRFMADARLESAELLLQEQIPQVAPLETAREKEEESKPQSPIKVLATPWPVPIDTPFPQAHYLSNGKMGSLITNAGGGFLSWKDTDLTRWRADSTRDNWGMWVYLQDMDSGDLWSVGQQPTQAEPEHRETQFAPHMVSFLRTDHAVTVQMQVTVSPEDDVELRMLRISNRSPEPRRIRVASYAEVILSTQEADRRHPVFNELFIESSFEPRYAALTFSRRSRSPQEAPAHLAHSLLIDRPPSGEIFFQSDRKLFLGRGGSAWAPAALDPAKPWPAGVTGPVLNPILSVGKVIELAPNATVQLSYLTAAAETRQAALALIEKYYSWDAVTRTFEIARSQSELELRQMNLTVADLQNIQRLFSLAVYPQPALRAAPAILEQNHKGQPALWPYSISGDFPIVLVRISNEEQLPLVRELLDAHTYWRNRGLKIDLVILNEKESSYTQEVQGALQRLLIRSGNDIYLNQRGGIFILRMDQLEEPDRLMLLTAARAILQGEKGSLGEQLQVVFDLAARLPPFYPTGVPETELLSTPPVERPANLLFDNGLGGFSPDGEEYDIYLEPGVWTPSPWSNVVANPNFGFIATEAGGGYTWAVNSGENRLTPWSNDPISDDPGEALYLRDEETGQIWTPTPLPAGADTPYRVRHSAGRTVYEHNSHGLKQRLELFVDPEELVKVARLRLENTWDRVRRITATYYVEWVLGVNRDTMQLYVVPEYDPELHALLARNPYSPEFAGRFAFLASSLEPHGLTTDRTEFLGRRRSMRRPAALERIGLSGTVLPGVDPCAAVMVHLNFQPGEVKEFHFILGQGEDLQDARRLIARFQQAETVRQAAQAVDELWDRVLGAVQVDTPDPAMNLMLNRWLLYQDLSCRVWGRSAFYQSSGAFGFRDQLQDVMALVFAEPGIARRHILRAARHQFEAGDVLHWWHPPSGRGVRTRITDDLLWLPYVTAEYVSATGDTGILNEPLPFLRGEPLKPDEDERYSQYQSTKETYPLYEHCLRAITKGSTAGRHGIPLIGTGDWNDGMNRVGEKGEGESIWLGWFLYAVLDRFIPIVKGMGDEQLAADMRAQADALAETLNLHGWDAEWYLRAFYDDDSPMGAKGNLECEIDAIAQSWSVLSGAGDLDQARQAMQSVDRILVREEDALVLLFTPPFDMTPKDPGYIKGYPPGIRENGGQYTHAATWTVWAQAALGNGDRAEELFRLINPINHANTPEKVRQYAVEPYVVAADVYSVPPHVGRGGWTWYTGSGGWFYRLGLTGILGFDRIGGYLRIDPAIPSHWPGCIINYRLDQIRYEIRIENPDGVSRGVAQITLDGTQIQGRDVPLHADGRAHTVVVRMGNQ